MMLLFQITLVWLLAAVRQASAVESLVDLGYTKLRGSAEAIGITKWLGVPYAAAPLGNLRFAAPVDPPPVSEVVDATQFRPICLPRSPTDFSMEPNERFRVDEDCLYLNIFAPSNVSDTSKLPVMYFVQGGGFQSNSNANFNGSDLSLFGNIIVVQVNYRVGPFGFLQSQEVMDNGSLNIGLRDQIQGLNWLKANVAAFGGDPDHIVAVGDSAGATSILLLMMAFAESDPAPIKGAIMESASVATIRSLEQGQEQYNCLVNATGCDGMPDTIACLRSVSAAALQTEECQFNPHLDGDLIKESMLDAFAAGNYLKIPTIAGTCNDEGTKNVPQDTNTTAQALEFMQNAAFNSLSNSSLSILAQTYLAPDPPAPVFPNSGPLWRPLANAMGDIRAHCITSRLQNTITDQSTAPTWNYRYAVLDPEDEADGFGAWHTVELNGVFGPNNTDGAPPSSYFTSNAPIVPLTMSYWASFIKTLDPNRLRLDGAPEWTPWTGNQGRQRLRFRTNDTSMETMDEAQMQNCEMVNPMINVLERPPEDSAVQVQLRRPNLPAATSAGNGNESAEADIALQGWGASPRVGWGPLIGIMVVAVFMA